MFEPLPSNCSIGVTQVAQTNIYRIYIYIYIMVEWTNPQWRDSNSQPYDCESCILTTAPSQLDIYIYIYINKTPFHIVLRFMLENNVHHDHCYVLYLPRVARYCFHPLCLCVCVSVCLCVCVSGRYFGILFLGYYISPKNTSIFDFNM